MSVDPTGEQPTRRRRARSNHAPARNASPQPVPAPATTPPAQHVTSIAPEAPEHLIVGQVASSFGLRGEMKVNILTEFPERLVKMEEVVLAPLSYLESGSSGSTDSARPSSHGHSRQSAPRTRNVQGFVAPRKPTPYSVVSTRVHKGQLLLKVAGIDNAEAVDMLRNYWVLVPREKAKKLPRGAYYLYEIEGLEVYDTNRRHIGKIQEVLTLTANDVYVVRGPGVTDPTGELLVPAVKAVVKRMEMKRGRIVIAPPEEWA